jgi:hypothetical protein
MSKNLLYALTLDGLLQSAVPLGSRVSLTYRLAAPVSKTTSKPAVYPDLSLAHLAQALGAPWRRPRQVRRAGPLDAHGSARPPWPGREVWR